MIRKTELLRNKILADIHDGNLAEKGRLPSRNQLVRKYGMSYGTVDETLKTLIAEGRLEGRRGSGTYVVEKSRGGVRKLFISSHLYYKNSDMVMRERIFHNSNWSIPSRTFYEDEVPVHLSEISLPGGAMIWFCPSMSMLYCMQVLAQAGIPQFLINRNYFDYEFVKTDQLETMREALTWLLIEGGREMSLVSYQPTPDRPYLYDRTVAFFECVCRLGGRLGSNAIHCRSFCDLAQDMVETVQQLLCGDKPVRSIAILHYDLVFPFVTCAFSMGKVPGKDYHLMSFDEVEELKQYPGICMVRQRYDYMIQEALRWLKERVDGRSERFHEQIKGELIITGA